MNRDLEKWLNWTWQNRDDIMYWARKSTKKTERTHTCGFGRNNGIKLIYAYYTGALGGQATENVTAQEARDPNMSQFAASLGLAMLELGAKVEMQAGKWRDIESASEFNKLTADQIAGAFFHFQNTCMTTTRRVYINLSPHQRGDTFRQILSRIWNVVGFDKAKVSGPGGPDRVDTVVIYCRDDKAQKDIVDALRTYNKNNLGRFRAPLPKLVSPVDGLTGIGCASEPPEVQIVREKGKTYFKKNDGQSFGAYRSEIIFTALEETLSSRDTPAIGNASQSQPAGRMHRVGGIEPVTLKDGRIQNVLNQLGPRVPMERMPVTNDVLKRRVFKARAFEFLKAGGVFPGTPSEQDKLTKPVIG